MYSPDINLHFIRHAETTFNRGTYNFKQRNPQYHNMNFDQLSNFPAFREEVRFNQSNIDCPITQEGREECIRAKEFLEQNNIKPDLILVSPFNRTLQTCSEIFGSQIDCPIIVEPLIGQILKSSCDIGHQLQIKKENFPGLIFDQCDALGNLWYIKKNSQRHQEQFRQVLEVRTPLSDGEIGRMILELMMQKDLVETQQDLLQRCRRAIKKIQQICSPKYRQIVIVTHFMFMECISASQFDQKMTPINGIKPKNCQVYTTKLSCLLQK